MPKIYTIKDLSKIDWKSHDDFQDYIATGEIEVGDQVRVENHLDCPLPLSEDEYCITFDKDFPDGGSFFTEEPFTFAECKLLFGDDFSY